MQNTVKQPTRIIDQMFIDAYVAYKDEPTNRWLLNKLTNIARIIGGYAAPEMSKEEYAIELLSYASTFDPL